MKILLIILKSILGITYMMITVIIGIMLFMNIDENGEKFIKKFEIKETEKILGGEIIKVVDYDNYKLRIHKPVFPGIFKERKKGFVQIDWFSNDSLPDNINEGIDYDNDGLNNFSVDLDTVNDKAVLTAYSDNVLNLMDKASIGSVILKSYADGRRGVFVFHDYNEARFLDYSFDYFNNFDAIKNIIVSEDQSKFNDFIENIKNGKNSGSIEILMNRKLDNNLIRINISYEKIKDKNKHKIIFNVIDDNINQQLTVLTSARDINKDFTAYPKTSYKEGRSVRVMLKK